MSLEFSYKTREKNLSRLKNESFDFLIIGGGITGAAAARDAALRGFKVALIEKSDFSSGTSSVSSKLVHGGLRYLENQEFHLVFESLSERAWMLRDCKESVKPFQFFIPVYKTEKRGMSIISIGLWLYDLLSLFRAPALHRRHSKKALQEALPGLKKEGLKGGFSYFDAHMKDDLLNIETLRSAHEAGAVIVNYVEGIRPLSEWVSPAPHPQVCGYEVKDCTHSQEKFSIRATRVIVCAGPWTDKVGHQLSETQSHSLNWENRLAPSRGTHLVFERNRIPVKGAVLMLHPVDGRVSFVMPREDLGAGVVIVGTTDGPVLDQNIDQLKVPKEDEDYILDLLNTFFPDLKLTEKDVISKYIGIRPLVKEEENVSLSKVSREHWIETFSNGMTFCAGGKYTTNRVMGKDIINHSIASWDEGDRKGYLKRLPIYREVETRIPLFKQKEDKQKIIESYQNEFPEFPIKDLEGYKNLKGQLLFSLRHEMTLNLNDFIQRRIPLYLSRRDHGESVYQEIDNFLKFFLK